MQKEKEDNRLSLKYLKSKRLVFLLLTFLVLTGYSVALTNNLVSDDLGLFKVKNQLTNLDYIFSDKFGFLWNLIHAPVYFLFGINPLVLRILNITVHLINSFLVYSIVSFLETTWIGLIAAGIFAVHPIAVESVSWISGGPYSWYTLFFLMSFFFYIKKTGNEKLYFLSITSFLLGLLTSNRAAPLFLMYFIYEFVYGNFRKNWPKLVPFIILGTIWILVYSLQIDSRTTDLNSYNNTIGVYKDPISIILGLSTYLWLWIWPEKLAFHHSTSLLTLPQSIIVAVIFLTLLFGSFFKNKKVFFGLSFFLVSISLYLMPFKISWIVAERYLYTGSIGLAIIAALFLTKLKRSTTGLLFLLIISSMLIRTYYRNLDWKDNKTLAQSNIRVDPQDVGSYHTLGEIYTLENNTTKAIEVFKKALGIDPNNYITNYDLGYLYKQENKISEAIFFFTRANNIDHSKLLPLKSLATIANEQKDYKLALTYYLAALKIEPTNVDILKGLRDTYLSLGDNQKSLEVTNKLNAEKNNQQN